MSSNTSGKLPGASLRRATPRPSDGCTKKVWQSYPGTPPASPSAIRCKATTLELDTATRSNADTCADYLLNKREYLDYPTALERGWPIATGVIEGACRHLVKDRMDITGARWGLAGAEAVLKLRAIICNHEFADYWGFHLSHEHARVHCSRYADRSVPRAA
jgi:hypothetical protein